METFAKGIGKFILSLITFCLGGLVLVAYWGWFAVPFFHTPDMPLPIALSLSSLIRYLTLDMTVKHEPLEETYRYILAFVIPTLWIAIGFILSRFVS